MLFNLKSPLYCGLVLMILMAGCRYDKEQAVEQDPAKMGERTLQLFNQRKLDEWGRLDQLLCARDIEMLFYGLPKDVRFSEATCVADGNQVNCTVDIEQGGIIVETRQSLHFSLIDHKLCYIQLPQLPN